LNNTIVFAASMLAAALLTKLVIVLARARGIMDVPNSRSSHTSPTPRGGGLAVAAVIVAGAVLIALYADKAAPMVVLSALIAILLAAVGYVDDARGLPALPRFGVHACAALALVVVAAQSLASNRLLPDVPLAVELGLLALAIMWSINLFNFMDGIDGIAASQAIFVSVSSASLMMLGDLDSVWRSVAILTAGASAGFLWWNWPPAKIFMGDVGSGFLGFWLAALAIGSHAAGTLPIWTSLILSALFVADATATLVRRLLSGERVYEAHRSHAYQILSRKWSSHLRVTSLLWVINLCVLLPLAYVSFMYRSYSVWIAIGALLLCGAGCAAVGSNRRAD